jgi:hypothetical protein
VLVVKAHAVSFVMRGGRRIKPPATAGLIHDENGQHWPRCSVLVMPYRPGTRRGQLTTAARRYFGAGYDARVSTLDLPPRDLGDWTELGAVERIFYTRAGAIFGGTRFQHKYKAGGWHFAFTGRRAATLYRRGGAYRLELGAGCVVNRRGFVAP